MEEQGLLKRTHGGAIPLPNVRTLAQPPSKRYGEGNAYQNAIAKTAARYIKEGQTIFIGGAAIHYVLLKYLPNNISYTILTNSIEIAYRTREWKHAKTYLIGGKVSSSGNMTDGFASNIASHFTIDVSFATAGGLSIKGLSTATPEVSIFNKTIYDNSNKIIAMIEHVKFGVDMFSRTYPLEKLNLIITDKETSTALINSVRTRGIEVIVAKQAPKSSV